MRYISLFSGVEAASVAWEALGWEPVAFSEIEPFCCDVLRERFPHVPNLGDITQIDWSDYRDTVDVVVGGSPCQSFSIAGKREGLRGESGLMFEYIRAVCEIRPRYFIWENVPGALSSEKGAAFGQLLTEMDDLGYGLAWGILDAQFFGVAQRRRRLFLVGVLGDDGAEKACEILFEREGLCWDYPSSKDKRKELAANAGCGSPLCHTFVDRCGCEGGGKGVLMQEEVASTLSTSAHQTVVHEGCLTPWDYQSKRVFGPKTATAPSLQAGSGGGAQCSTVCYAIQGSMIGRSESAGSQGDGINDDLSFTLNTADRHAVCFQQNTRDEVRLINGDGELAGALMANPGAKQQNYICMADDNANAAIDEDMCGSLKVRGGTPIICTYAVGALCARDHKGVSSQFVSEGKVIPMFDGIAYVVRRLTPVECERLQGFPDDWTSIPYRNKPADQCPDSPRYKAMGNSMAVPVMRWLGERIELVEGSAQDGPH